MSRFVGLRSPHFAVQTLGYCFNGSGTSLRGHQATPDSPFPAYDMTKWMKMYCIPPSLGIFDSHAGESPAPGDHSTDACQPTIYGHLVSGCSLPRIQSEWAFGGSSATRLELFAGVTRHTRQQVVHVWTGLMCIFGGDAVCSEPSTGSP